MSVDVPTAPRLTFAVGYEGRMLEEGDEFELNEQDGRRLSEAGAFEEASSSKTRHVGSDSSVDIEIPVPLDAECIRPSRAVKIV